jgi:DNA polymerase type B, organellar and viral
MTLKKGYTGGHTDVYKPFGKNVYRYDVNSLYPFVMSKFAMPVGKITYFEGNILKVDSNAFGFFEVEVTTPAEGHMDRPLLQTKCETNGGLRTVAQLGKWEDMVFSEEMNEYLKYGYKFKVLRGYLFEKGYIFKDYVEDLYQIKQSVMKDDPMYAISKLLLNSLYGRFGMDYLTLVSKHVILHNVLSYQILDKNIITGIINLENDQSLISYIPKDIDDQLSLEYFDNINFNVSISIAAAVTACARIHMSQFLGDKNLNVLYTDTDSIDIDQPLDHKFIGKELGLMKLECIFEEAVFLAPKVYGGIIDNEKSITKVKGFKNEVEYSELKSLLIKDTSLELKQDKWFSSIKEGTITIIEQLYKLVPTDNKRQLIYLHNKFVNTKPFKINTTRSLK